MTKGEAFKLVAILSAAFPTPAWPQQTLEVYRDMIADLDAGAASAAVRAWVLANRERPSVADIRDATRKQLDAAGITPHEVDPDEAWGFVVRCMSSIGSYRPFPADKYPEVAAIVQRMGWETLCRSDNPEADRAHFLRLFELERKRVREARVTSPGLHRPDDAERSAAQGRPTIGARSDRFALPDLTPEQRADGQRSIAGIIAQLTGGRPQAATEKPRRVGADYVEPTADELAAAQRRKSELMAAMTRHESNAA